MGDLQRDLRAYIEHLADLAELDPRSRTAPIPRHHPRPPRRMPPRVLTAAVAAVVAASVAWITLDGGDGSKKISTPRPSVAARPASPPNTAIPLPPADELWNTIAECETGGNWDAPGQKYQGGLGIYFKNWEHYGGVEFAPTAGQASRDQQIIVAERIRAEHGLGAWGCGKTLGFAETEPENYIDKLNGFSVEIPRGWGQGTGVHDLILLETAEMGTTCDGTAARNAAFISVSEIRPAGSADSAPIAGQRPDTFGPTSGSFDSANQRPDAPGTCTLGVDLAPTQSIAFMDHGRKVQITMRFYPDASVTRRAQAYGILNSMQFEPESALHRGRPANEVFVFVLDAARSSIAQGKAASTINTLRGLGYGVTGSAEATNQQNTTVACKHGRRDDARALVRIVGDGAVVKTYSDAVPRVPKVTHCIVTVGTG